MFQPELVLAMVSATTTNVAYRGSANQEHVSQLDNVYLAQLVQMDNVEVRSDENVTMT